MRIALFSDTYPPELNGVATTTQTLRKAFMQHGHTVYVVTTNPFSNKLEYKDGILRIPGMVMKKIYNYRLPGFFHPKVTSIIKSWNLDIIHVQTESTVGMYARAVAKRLSIALVSTYHTSLVDYTYMITHGYMDQTAKAIVKLFTKSLSKISTEFTTPSVKTKDALRTYGIERYINVIPNGLDLSSFDPSKVDQERLLKFKKEHDLIGKTTLLSLGRLGEEKSNDVILKCYAKFLKSNPNKKTKLLIVGDGPNKKDLEKLTYELGIAENVEFIGKVPYSDVPFYYTLGEVFLCASLTETQGMTFIEAIASKTIVLCRFDENLVDVIQEGETGFYFSNEESFITKLNMILNMSEEKKNEVIEKSYIHNQRYSLERYYESMLEVYNRALRKRW